MIDKINQFEIKKIILKNDLQSFLKMIDETDQFNLKKLYFIVKKINLKAGRGAVRGAGQWKIGNHSW